MDAFGGGCGRLAWARTWHQLHTNGTTYGRISAKSTSERSTPLTYIAVTLPPSGVGTTSNEMVSPTSSARMATRLQRDPASHAPRGRPT